MRLRTVLVILFQAVYFRHDGDCAKIFFTYCHDGGSHIGSLAPYMKTLAANGHNITLLQTGREAQPRNFGKNVSVIVWQTSAATEIQQLEKEIIWQTTTHASQPTFITTMSGVALGNFLLNRSDAIRDLLNVDWDLLVLDSLFNVHGFAFAMFLKETRNIPYILYDPSLLLPSDVWTKGLGGSWSSQLSIDSFIGFGDVTPRATDIRYYGAYCDIPKTLNKEFRQFVEDKESKGIHALLWQMEYRIIFSFNADPPPNVGKHIKLVKWAPQFDVLAHNKTVLFLTHGGLKSIKEGICSKRALTFLPLFAEQARNSAVSAALGLGTIINKYTMTKESVTAALREAIENSKYAKHMEELYSRYLDYPMPPLEEAKFFTERIRLAVDISLWLYQAELGFAAHNLDSRSPHISLLLHRISKLLFYKIRPVFVFDGKDVPAFKKQILRDRALKRQLKELASEEHDQKQMLKKVVQEKHDSLDDGDSMPDVTTKKKPRKSDEDMFILPSTSSLRPEKEILDDSLRHQIPDYLEGYERIVSADDRMSFLKDARDKSRNERLRFDEIPEESREFSSFQLQRLVNRNKISTQMEMDKLQQCVQISADKLKMVVVDNQLRSHLLLRDGDIQILDPSSSERQKMIKESLTWPQFLKQMEQEKDKLVNTPKSFATIKANGTIRETFRYDTHNRLCLITRLCSVDDEDDDLQQAILASLAEQDSLTSNKINELYGTPQAANFITQDLWSSDEEELEHDNHSVGALEPIGIIESNSEESGSDDELLEPKSPTYYPKKNDLLANGNMEADESGVYKDCQALVKLGLVDGVISDDSDVWLFGAPLVYKNMFSKKKHVEEYRIERISAELGLERIEFIAIGMLSGGDYTKGFEQVGVVSALELIAEFSKSNKAANNGLKEEVHNLLIKIREWLHSKHEFLASNRNTNFIESKKRIRLRRIIEAHNDPKKISQPFKWRRVSFEKLEQRLWDLGLDKQQWKKATHDAFERWDKFIEQTTQSYQTRIDAFTVSRKYSMGILESARNLSQTARIKEALQRIKTVKSPTEKEVHATSSEGNNDTANGKNKKVPPNPTSKNIKGEKVKPKNVNKRTGRSAPMKS
ncbi:UDP-glucoronosyl and UDP-glucosyl transferase domain-containing protein [Ditylenchus destructor]|nr:UDP-glucoronosyl and UDP-glucosyl transferase domain-containing protein [Ditylenchus destructor]